MVGVVTSAASGMGAMADPRYERVVDPSALAQRFDGGWADDGGWPGGLQPTSEVAAADTAVRARVSAAATLGLIISVVGLCAVLTGLLLPEGFAIGVIGVLLSIGGFAAAGRPAVAGRGVAVVGIMFGLAAVILAALAVTGVFAWPDSSTDQVGRWHDWLVGHWAWLGRWS